MIVLNPNQLPPYVKAVQTLDDFASGITSLEGAKSQTAKLTSLSDAVQDAAKDADMLAAILSAAGANFAGALSSAFGLTQSPADKQKARLFACSRLNPSCWLLVDYA